MKPISFYKTIKQVKSTATIEMFDLLDKIHDGEWQDIVLTIRNAKSEEEKKKLKSEAPNVTISGVFETRKDRDILSHSGFIGIDIDDLGSEVERVRKMLSKDRYCFAIFTSISGKGLCMVIKVDPERHRDAFEGFSSYLLDNYGIVVDYSGINESRARYVSYDPYLIVNEKSAVFKKYLKKQKKRQYPAPIYVKDDFDTMISEMVNRGVDCTEDYRDWIRVGFALASKFGEGGRAYFHQLSSISGKYDTDQTDRKYSNLLKSKGGERPSTIGTIYWFAKQAGIPIHGKKNEDIIRSANSQKKAGIANKQDILKTLELSGHDVHSAEPIVEQVLKNRIPDQKEDLLSDVVALIGTFGLRKNEITRNIEWNGRQITDSDINTIYLDVKSRYEKVNKDLVNSIIFSNRIPSFHPIKDFLNSDDVVGREEEYSNLQLLLDSIETDTPNYQKWVTKWLVGLLATAHGKHSPLMLVFAGEAQGTGKTHFFRYLLPDSLQPLYAESKMDNGKDDEILMTKKWIICDDEMGGKSKKEATKFKEITSKQWINVREPYGRVTIDLRRMSMFCGTTNDMQVLHDVTGNRRYLPIHILGIDHDKYNECNKEELIYELNHLYKSGYDYTILNDEIKQLNENTDIFKASTPEEELIMSYLRKGTSNIGKWASITQITEFLLKFSKRNNLNNYRIGSVLSKMGYQKSRKTVDGNTMTVYLVDMPDPNIVEPYQEEKEDDLPF